MLWIIRIVSMIVIPGIITGIAVSDKAVDAVSCIVPRRESGGIMAEIVQLGLTICDAAITISQIEMRSIIVIRILQRPITC